MQSRLFALNGRCDEMSGRGQRNFRGTSMSATGRLCSVESLRIPAAKRDLADFRLLGANGNSRPEAAVRPKRNPDRLMKNKHWLVRVG